LISRLLLGSSPQNEITRSENGTLRRPFVWSSTPNPPNSKIGVKPRTNRKGKNVALHLE